MLTLIFVSVINNALIVEYTLNILVIFFVFGLIHFFFFCQIGLWLHVRGVNGSNLYFHTVYTVTPPLFAIMFTCDIITKLMVHHFNEVLGCLYVSMGVLLHHL